MTIEGKMSWDTKIINKFGASSLEKRALSRRAKCKLFWVGQEYKTVQKDLRLCRFCGFHVHKIHKICTISNIFGQSYIPDPLMVITVLQTLIIGKKYRLMS